MKNIQKGDTVRVKSNVGLVESEGLTGKVSAVYAANGTEVKAAPFNKKTTVDVDFGGGGSHFFSCDDLEMTTPEEAEV